jgi:antitoxin CptB
MHANVLNESRAWPAPTGGIVDKGLERVRWRSRRGLLELDIVLGRFIDKHYAQLDEAGKQAFEALLDMPDNPLWDMIAGRQEATHGEQQALLEKIRAV